VNITYVYADSPQEWNCSEWRCAIPARAIQRTRRHKADLIDLDSFAFNKPGVQDTLNHSDVIIVQRNFFGPVLKAIQRWRALEKLIIVDFDDAYDLIPPQNVNHSFWAEGKINRQTADGQTVTEVLNPPPLTQFKWGLKLAHAATVPSTQLAEDWRSCTDVHVVPNYLDLDRYVDVRPKSHDGIIIGWGGSLSHLQSFNDSGVLTALQRICKARKNVKVMICGDQRVYQRLPLPASQKLFQPWVPFDQWAQVLSQFDIGLAPLSGDYDQRRSWIKVLEYMIMRIPWVASDGPAYYNLRSHGWLVQNVSNAWERILMDMVDHLDDYKIEASREPYLFAISQGINENVENIIATYSGIMNKHALGETAL